jgi:hypothetical protein
LNDGKQQIPPDSGTRQTMHFTREFGGRERVRTADPLLAKQVLSQLSYTPTVGFTFILKHLPPFRIPILRNIVLREVSVRRWDSFLQPSLHSRERNNRTCLVSRSAAPIEIVSSNQPPQLTTLLVRKGLLEQGKPFAFGFTTQRSAAEANGSFPTQAESPLGNCSILRASE